MTGPFCNDVDIFSTYEIGQGFERTKLWILYIEAMRIRVAEISKRSVSDI